MSEELKGCPWCGGKYFRSAHFLDGWKGRCLICGADGPRGENPSEARDKWNQRAESEMFQKRVTAWLMECFSMEVCRDDREQAHRFIEEAVELVQARGIPKEDVLMLVDYVYGRPKGVKKCAEFYPHRHRRERKRRSETAHLGASMQRTRSVMGSTRPAN